MFGNVRSAVSLLPLMRCQVSSSCRTNGFQTLQSRSRVREASNAGRLVLAAGSPVSRTWSVGRIQDHDAIYHQNCRHGHMSATYMASGQSVKEAKQPSVETHESHLVLDHPSMPHSLKLHYFWLRDHCRCNECYSAATYQRANDILKIPIDIQPLECEVRDDVLHIHWRDDHNSEYSVTWLMENSYELQGLSAVKVERATWNSVKFGMLQLPAVNFQQLLEDDNVLRDLLRSFLVYGIGLVHQVPCSSEGTRQAVQRVGPVMNTFYGLVFDFKAGDTEFQDTAYSSDALGPHTDLTYCTEAAGVQVFHVLEPAARGGDTLLVDGFEVAQQFQKINPEGYQLLSNVPQGGEYVGVGKHHLNVDAIFKHHPITKELWQIRYNLYDRSPMTSLPFKELTSYYKSLRDLDRMVRSPDNEAWMKLQPGTVLMIDNWRVMHGRSAFSGSRIMSGCYMSRTDVMSAARTLGLVSTAF